jgi:hypothetical protein
MSIAYIYFVSFAQFILNEHGGNESLTSTVYNQRVFNTLLDGSNVRLNWNIESDMNVNWIKFKNFLSLY